jgi:hypothetical protein
VQTAFIFHDIPIWALYIVTVAFVLLSVEVGYRVGALRRHRAASEKDAPIGGLVAATLGLLAFLLAFTFGGFSWRPKPRLAGHRAVHRGCERRDRPGRSAHRGRAQPHSVGDLDHTVCAGLPYALEPCRHRDKEFQAILHHRMVVDDQDLDPVLLCRIAHHV